MHTVIVTHSHPGHFGAAGRIRAETGADAVTHDSLRMWWDAAEDFAAPRPSRRVIDGVVLPLAGRELVALHTPGHTVDHLCLWDRPEGCWSPVTTSCRRSRPTSRG